MTLLIAQMKNQDPMEPMASSDYVAQLATFSQVEKTVQTNERLASLLNTGNLQLAESLIGRAVVDTESQVGGTVVAAKVVDNGVDGTARQWLGIHGRSRTDHRRGRQDDYGRQQRRHDGVNEADAMELVQAAIWTVIVVAGPCVLAAMVVGIAIALLQALTQVQEVTLTFVPKIMAIFLVWLCSPRTSWGPRVFPFAQLTFLHVERGF